MQELHPLIDLNGFPIFSILVAVGLIFSSILYFYNSKMISDVKFKKDDAILYMGISYVFGIALSNVANWYIFPEYADFSMINKIKFAGFTFYFGLIGFISCLYILLLLAGYNSKIYINAIVPSVTLFHLFGRMGCLLAGCCFGKEGNYSIFSFSINRFPVIEFEIMFLLLLTFIFQKYIKQNRLVIYLFSYSVFRFAAEFQRGDNRGKLFTNTFSPSQEISIAIFVLSILLLVYIFLRRKSYS